jgi:hypothetical protein
MRPGRLPLPCLAAVAAVLVLSGEPASSSSAKPSPAKSAPAGRSPSTVDQMTCDAAQRQVLATGRYEKSTSYGVLPIIPPFQVRGGVANCPVATSPSFFFERTRDVQACILGYSCERKNNR